MGQGYNKTGLFYNTQWGNYESKKGQLFQNRDINTKRAPTPYTNTVAGVSFKIKSFCKQNQRQLV